MRKSTKLKIFRRKKRSVILSVLKRHSLRQHTLKRYLLKTLKNSKKKAMISEVCCKNITIEEKPLWGTNGNLWFRVNDLTFDCNIAIISCVTIVNKFVTIETAL